MAVEWAVIVPDGTAGWLPPGSAGDARPIADSAGGGCRIMPATGDGRLWLMAASPESGRTAWLA